MRINEILTEAFNQPYPIRFKKTQYGDYDALARLADGTNLSINFNSEDEEGEMYHVEFWRNNSLAVTGEGDAQRIFATVLEAIKQFIIKAKPKYVSFTADKEVESGQNPESRSKLYDRLVSRYASQLGYIQNRKDHGSEVEYSLTRAQ